MSWPTRVRQGPGCWVAACAAGALALDPAWAWLVAGLVFLLVAVGLLGYWRASMAELDASIRPIFPTPADEVAVPF